MSDTQILPNPPTAILKAAHLQMKELFARYNALRAEDRRAKKLLFHEIQEGLQIHLEIEEVLFYPAVQSMKADLAIRVVLKALQDHHKVKAFLGELGALDSENKSLDAKMSELQHCVLAHLEMEERDIFPQARVLTPETLQELSAEMETLRDRLLEDRRNLEPPPG